MQSRCDYSRIGVVAFALACFAVATPGRGDSSVPTSDLQYNNEAQLVERLWKQSPEVLEARAALDAARSDLQRAQTLPNPNLDFAWGTIPVGRTNPPQLKDPLSNVPSYTTGVAELVELGKRGPRQKAAFADVQRGEQQALAALGDRFFALLGRIGQIAAAQQRVAILSELVAASNELMSLDRARSSKGEIPALELERTEVEHERLVSERDAAVTEQTAAQAECSTILAASCPPFESGIAAHAFLSTLASSSQAAEWSTEAVARRPDVAALEAAARAADDRAVLANRRIIPDVTVRLGYTYDSFIVSGNQRNSLGLGLQLPIPLFDRGQADLHAALSERVRAQRARESLLAAVPSRLVALARQRDLILDRIQRIDRAVEKARSVSDALREAQRAGGTSQIEVLLARRAYHELLLERSALDGDAFDILMMIRQSLGLFPHPSDPQTPLTP
ncbi:MAG: TolC family protein [Deltaproteobacteria bacterium]|nr:TolC family protein [Deltaproteobacteria bacterium]